MQKLKSKVCEICLGHIKKLTSNLCESWFIQRAIEIETCHTEKVGLYIQRAWLNTWFDVYELYKI